MHLLLKNDKNNFNSEKICRVEWCTKLFYVIIPTLFPCFLLISYPYILLYIECFLNQFYSNTILLSKSFEFLRFEKWL